MKTFRFINAREFEALPPGIRLFNYKEHDLVVPKRPIAVLASGVLTEETRRQISHPCAMFHHVVMIRNGLMVPQISESLSTIVNFSPEGYVICDYGDEERTLRRTPYWLNAEVTTDGVRTCKARFDDVIKIDGPAFPLQFTPSVHHWFSHFIIQCLPRVLAMEAIGVPDASIIVPSTLRKKQMEMLIHAGFPRERIIQVPESAVCQADELYVPMAWPLLFSSFTVPVFDRILTSLNISTKVPADRLLISRAMRKTWRNMLNSEAMERTLVDDFGFKVVMPENLTLAEEVSLFHNARTVVGAEGAGLYGGVYSQRGSTYVSVSDDDYSMPILGTLATLKGFDIAYVFGESFQSAQDLKRRLPYGHTDFVVDPKAVAAMVEYVERSPRAR